nr:hypothetical protein [Prochloraceae cyanobacterium]
GINEQVCETDGANNIYNHQSDVSQPQSYTPSTPETTLNPQNNPENHPPNQAERVGINEQVCETDGANNIYNHQSDVSQPQSYTPSNLESILNSQNNPENHPPNQAERVAVNEQVSETDRGNFLTQLLTAIENLESQRIGFTSREELNQFTENIETRAAQIEGQLLANCPDYYERLVVAVANLELGDRDPFDELIENDVEQNLSSTGAEFEQKYQELQEHFAKTYFTDEGIAELASMLSLVDSAEHLREINELEFYDRTRYNQAAKLLAKEKRQELSRYAKQLNEIEGVNRPSSYLERWRLKAGLTVQAVVNKAGSIVKEVGQFVGLELVNNNCMAKVIIDGMVNYYQPHKLEFN